MSSPDQKPSFPSPNHEIADLLSKGEVLRPKDFGQIYETYGYSAAYGLSHVPGCIVGGRFFRETGVRVRTIAHKGRNVYICETLDEKPLKLDEVLAEITQEVLQQRREQGEKYRAKRAKRLTP